MLLTVKRSALMPMIVGILSLTVAACSTLSNPSPTWPTNLNVIVLSDGGICLDATSARRLAELRADLEAL